MSTILHGEIIRLIDGSLNGNSKPLVGRLRRNQFRSNLISCRFAGRWEALSVFDVVDAPLGDEVFGGKPVLTAAQKDLESKLSYPVLFRTLSPDQILSVASIGINGSVISDRLYNVEQIALASMGPNSIIDDAQKVLARLTLHQLHMRLFEQYLIFWFAHLSS